VRVFYGRNNLLANNSFHFTFANYLLKEKGSGVWSILKQKCAEKH